jgi:hypothetical protein
MYTSLLSYFLLISLEAQRGQIQIQLLDVMIYQTCQHTLDNKYDTNRSSYYNFMKLILLYKGYGATWKLVGKFLNTFFLVWTHTFFSFNNELD